MTENTIKNIALTTEDFGQALPKLGAVLGFDYGEKRLGVAVSDPLRSIATPCQIIYRTAWSKDLAEIKRLISQKEICAIVYGLPLLMNGSEGNTAASVRAFALKLDQEVHLPFMFWDERLSSCAVESFLIQKADFSRQKRKKVLDASAAAYILQGALDCLQRYKSNI